MPFGNVKVVNKKEKDFSVDDAKFSKQREKIVEMI
jgi:hypothetical protein